MRKGEVALENGPRLCLSVREMVRGGDSAVDVDVVTVFRHVLCTWWKNASMSALGACRSYEKVMVSRKGDETSETRAVH